ncbi:MAG TPA: response regulator transcription factor [Acidimicrobiales bacterium]|nr:response regulator transcription factor [Acidimicrobiales bacterium]
MTDPIRVVLVDDHSMLAESLRRLLDSCDDIDVVEVAGTAGEGMDAVTRLRPDVVLMDYYLPDRDGVTAAAAMMEANPATRVVILTGSDDDEGIALRAIGAGCAGFLGKSRPIHELLAGLRAARAGESVMSPSMLTRLLPRLESDPRENRRKLTERELQVLRVMAQGGSDKDIASDLAISLNTARKHVQNVIRKLDVHSKLEAVVIAIRQGIIDPL